MTTSRYWLGQGLAGHRIGHCGQGLPKPGFNRKTELFDANTSTTMMFSSDSSDSDKNSDGD